MLPKLDPNSSKLIQNRLNGIYIITIFVQQFQYIFKRDIASLICTVHQFLYHVDFCCLLGSC